MCKLLFLSTLAISGQRLNSALSVNNGNNVGIAPTEIKAGNKNPSRGFKWDLGDQDFLKNFLESYQKLKDIIVAKIPKIYTCHKLYRQ